VNTETEYTTDSKPASFPCIICGRTLERAWAEGSEAQPSEGIMCETAGNYGSTVWDSMDGERLAFNICDPCMARAGGQGRVMTYRRYRPILVAAGPLHRLVVGRENLRDRPYVRWHAGMPGDDEPLWMDLEELEHLPASCELTVPLDQITEMLK
jgi:hypothetical protein